MRPFVKIAVVLLLVVAAGAGLYVAADPERLEIDQAVRASAPGSSSTCLTASALRIGGPVDGRGVLAAGIMSRTTSGTRHSRRSLSRLPGASLRLLRPRLFRSARHRTRRIYVRQLAELPDAVHITQPIDLAGLSYGGSVVTSFADRFPDRVRSLIYVDPSFWSPYAVTALQRMPRVWNYLTAIFEERWWADTQLDDFLRPERFPDWPDRYKVQMQYRGFRRAQRSTSVANATVDQAPQLKRVGEHLRPVIVFWGKEDQAVPFEFSSTLLEAMPRARLVPVASSGHLPQWEQPDVVHPALIDFLHRSTAQ